jgi:hypothetical protein
MYREHGLNNLMEICVRAGVKLLDDEAGSRSAFYGLKSITETLAWLHFCLDRYYCLICYGPSWLIWLME